MKIIILVTAAATIFVTQTALAVIGGIRVGSSDPLFNRVVQIHIYAQTVALDDSQSLRLNRNTDLILCTGVIIGDQQILTSAHCGTVNNSVLSERMGLDIRTLLEQNQIELNILGCVSIPGATGARTQVRAPALLHCGSFELHPYYRLSAARNSLQRTQHDLAVLKMGEDFSFPSNMVRFEFFSSRDLPRPQELFVAGYGLESLSPYRLRLGTLRMALMLSESSSSRVLRPRDSSQLRTFSLLYSATEPSLNGVAANGDSGAPVYFMNGDRFILIGLISGGSMDVDDFSIHAELRDYEAYFTDVYDPINWNWISQFLN